MAVIRLPDHLQASAHDSNHRSNPRSNNNVNSSYDGAAPDVSAPSSTSADAKYIQDILYEEYGIEVPIKCLFGVLFVRISCHIYNTLSQYERLAGALLQPLDDALETE